MAKSKDDIKYGTAQAKLAEDEQLRIRYKHGTPLEGGKIANSERVDLFAGAQRIAEMDSSSSKDGDSSTGEAAATASNTNTTNNTNNSSSKS